MAAGTTTKNVLDGAGAPFASLVYDNGSTQFTPTSYVPDGYNVSLGAVADAAWSGSGNGTLISVAKANYTKAEAIRALLAGTLAVSALSLPLPTGAATSAKQAALGTAGTPSADVLSVQGVNGGYPVGVAGATATAVASASNPIPVQVGNGTTQISIQTGSMTDGASNSPSGRIIVQTYAMRFNGTNWDRARKANATSRLVSSAATTNATSVKTSAGDLFEINGYNAAASAVFLKFYNKASAPTVGTDTPVQTLRLAPGAAFTYRFDALYFATGIAFALTGAAADADTTAVASGDVTCLNISYA